jgi:DNA-directed RNA polymerase specialized sigma24 family protein
MEQRRQLSKQPDYANDLDDNHRPQQSIRLSAAGSAHDVEIDADTSNKEVMNAMEGADPTPLEALQLTDDAKALANCLGRLESLYRQAIVLSFYHDLLRSE